MKTVSRFWTHEIAARIVRSPFRNTRALSCLNWPPKSGPKIDPPDFESPPPYKICPPIGLKRGVPPVRGCFRKTSVTEHGKRGTFRLCQRLARLGFLTPPRTPPFFRVFLRFLGSRCRWHKRNPLFKKHYKIRHFLGGVRVLPENREKVGIWW